MNRSAKEAFSDFTVNGSFGLCSEVMEFELIRTLPADQNTPSWSKSNCVICDFWWFSQREVHTKITLEVEFHSHYCFNYGSAVHCLSIKSFWNSHQRDVKMALWKYFDWEVDSFNLLDLVSLFFYSLLFPK